MWVRCYFEGLLLSKLKNVCWLVVYKLSTIVDSLLYFVEDVMSRYVMSWFVVGWLLVVSSDFRFGGTQKGSGFISLNGKNSNYHLVYRDL